MTNSASEMIIYQSEDGKIHLETRLENETLWMTQRRINIKCNSQEILVGSVKW